MKRFLIAFILLSFAFADASYAQLGRKYHYGKRKRAPHGHGWVWTKRKQYFSAGLSLNALNYFGDITPQQNLFSTDIKFTRPSLGLFVQRRFRPQWTWRLEFAWGRTRASDEKSADPQHNDNQYRYIRNLHFRNDIFQLGALLQFDLIDKSKLNKIFYKRPNQIIPYLVLGVAGYYHNPKAKTPLPNDLAPNPEAEWEVGKWTALQPLGTEGQGRIDPRTNESLGKKYSKLQLAIPMGIGVRKKISQRIDIAFEFRYHFLFTDYLDDVSKDYVDLGVFGDDNLTKAFHDRSREGGRRVTGVTAYEPSDYQYVGVDGQAYTTYTGFGNDQFPDNIRGNVRDNDIYTITGFHFTYIFPPEGVRCPIRFR